MFNHGDENKSHSECGDKNLCKTTRGEWVSEWEEGKGERGTYESTISISHDNELSVFLLWNSFGVENENEVGESFHLIVARENTHLCLLINLVAGDDNNLAGRARLAEGFLLFTFYHCDRETVSFAALSNVSREI